MRVGNTLYTAAGLLLVTMMTMTSAGCAAAGLSGVTAKQDQKDPNTWVLQNAKVQVVVNASLGRIMHYGFRGGENVFWTNPEAEKPEYKVGGWDNWGGDKVWPWPQELFGWPPPEAAYQVQVNQQGDGLVMTSEVIASIGARVVRTIELAGDSSSMVVSSRLEPAGTSFGKPMAAWCITQVPTPKQLYVRIPLAGDRNRYLGRKVDPAKDNFQAKSVGGRVARLTNPAGGGKTFMDADVIAAVFDDTVLLQRQLPIQEEGVWAHDERAQIYAHPVNATNVPGGRSYYELEWSAPVLPPNRVEKAPLRVIYKLVKLGKDTTEEQIAEMIEKLP